MMHKKNLLYKEYYLQASLLSLGMLTLIWTIFALYFLAAFQEYQHLAPQLAQLENRRGATQMLLLPVNQLVIWIIITWSVFFAARTISQEYQWQTITLYPKYLGGFFYQIIFKIIVLIIILTTLIISFWFGVAWLSQGTQFDNGLLIGFLASQILTIAYAIGLSLTISIILKQNTSASMCCAIIWLLWWLLPLLFNSPASLVAMLQWLSPFAHNDLLMQGQFTLQTLIFIILHIIFFLSLIYYYQQENH
ncbi:hypothetical protein [Suttonella ornithocola]|uniref:ABC-2 family transporter protein n=1 Tax=Suttonella ornithocola TaxID=279832 RepID=A0A380MLR6_9GAMM|nr:hypothetical protein [Suttonella ornithocola]SUO92996.1 Uncharacterised protein [Suttonella ornithocola]